jgi:hypothetical protein
MGKMNPRVVLSVVLLLVASTVLFTGFTATATTSPASYCYWDPATKQNVCVSDLSEFSQPTTSQKTSQLPNYPNYPNYQNYPPTGSTASATTAAWNAEYSPWYTTSTQDHWTYVYQQNYQGQTSCLCNPSYPNCPCHPSYPSYLHHHYYPGYGYAYYPAYGYGYYPGYGYEVATTTETATTTSYSTVTETSEVTSTTTSVPEPVTVTTSATVTTTATTRDTTAEMLYGSLMAVFLALFLATLVLLIASRSRGSKGSNPQLSQAAVAAPAPAYIATSHKCSACGTEVDPNMKFCGNCGAQLKAK